MVDLLRDSMISCGIAFLVVWISISDFLVVREDGSIKSNINNSLYEAISWVCNKTILLERDYTTIPEIYIGYILILLVPTFISVFIHFIARALPQQAGYQETTLSPLKILNGNEYISKLMEFIRSALAILVIKTPIAFGSIMFSVGIFILSGKMGDPARSDHITWAVLPFIFFSFVGLSQIALIVTTYFNAMALYSDSRKLSIINQRLSDTRVISKIRIP